jgi:16S rRNA (guanine527-N7)-methyltransferase
VTNAWLPRSLEISRERGFLSPQPLEPQIEHAKGFAAAWNSVFSTPPENFLDLGSGGGLPGLVLLQEWNNKAVLMDAMEKRVAFLQEVLESDDTPGDAEAIQARAETLSREPKYTEAFDLVTARSFGPPAITAECAVRFMKVGGLLIVSEPPDDDAPNRWPVEGLRKLGLENLGRHRFGAAFQILRKTSNTPSIYPRESGTPKKKPLF